MKKKIPFGCALTVGASILLTAGIAPSFAALSETPATGAGQTMGEYYPGFTPVVLNAEQATGTASVNPTEQEVTYRASDGTFTYTEDGQEKTIKLSDITGFSKDWLTKMGVKDGDKVKVTLSGDGTVSLVTKYDGTNKVFEYDAANHLMAHFHTEGAVKGKADYITSESTRTSTWRSKDVTDPGMGKDGHVKAQQYSYDEAGNLTEIQYFTWTAGNRKKTEDSQKYSRYCYRKDTFKDGQLQKTEYFDDPRPTYWEPVVTGTVKQDEKGRYFLEAENDDGSTTQYLLTARMDGFDVDGDGKSGAAEMNGVDWKGLVGKEITVRGHQIDADQETDLYVDGKKAEMFAVVDVVEEGETLKEGWNDFEQKVADAMSKVFVLLGSMTDQTEIYDKIYTAMIPELKKAGVTDADVEKFGSDQLKNLWEPSDTEDTSSQALMTKAWDNYNKNDFTPALTFTQKTIELYRATALEQQKNLSSFAPAGKENDYWALNDVATAYFIEAEIARKRQEIEKAKENYTYIIENLKYAQCWDSQGWFWKIAEAAQKELDKLQ